jgi:amino acid transporter
MRGTRLSSRFQNTLAIALVASVALAAVAGFVIGPEVAVAPAVANGGIGSGGTGVLSGIGFAMIFIMLTYGGWNEAAYISAELKDVRRTMVRVVTIATAVVAVLYLGLNAAYLHVLGPAAMGRSDAIGADYMHALLGRPGSVALSVLVVVAALTTLNATIFTGARSAYALGRDHFPPAGGGASGVWPLLGRLGRWDGGAQGPANAHLVQAVLAIALIGFGTATRQGFATMVDYTAPVFWFFLLLTGISLFVLRGREKSAVGQGVAGPGEGTGESPAGAGSGFRVPFYPLTPLLFCASAGFMLHAALAYTGAGALVGVGAVLAGLPLWALIRRRNIRLAVARAGS